MQRVEDLQQCMDAAQDRMKASRTIKVSYLRQSVAFVAHHLGIFHVYLPEELAIGETKTNRFELRSYAVEKGSIVGSLKAEGKISMQTIINEFKGGTLFKEMFMVEEFTNPNSALNFQNLKLASNQRTLYFDVIDRKFSEVKNIPALNIAASKGKPVAVPDEQLADNSHTTAKHPEHHKHYNEDQVATLIYDFNLTFNIGNAVKYLFREQDKGGNNDLVKVLDYVAFELKMRLGEEEATALIHERLGLGAYLKEGDQRG